MFRTIFLTPHARRCSGAVVAAAAAAMVLTPGVASAAGQPAGPGSGHTVSHKTGHTGHAGTGKATSHKSGHAGTGRSGTGHTGTGHTGTGHSTRHTGTGHSATGRTGAHGTNASVHHTGAGAASGRGGSASDADTSGTADSAGSGSGSPGSKKSSSAAATVTKLSVSNTAEDGSVTLSARVSPAHRTGGGAPATGTVVFTLDGASSEPVPLSGGRAAVQAEVGPGEHTASAKYSGDAEHAPSASGPVSVVAG